jgi:hypothetical protein
VKRSWVSHMVKKLFKILKTSAKIEKQKKTRYKRANNLLLRHPVVCYIACTARGLYSSSRYLHSSSDNCTVSASKI